MLKPREICIFIWSPFQWHHTFTRSSCYTFEGNSDGVLPGTVGWRGGGGCGNNWTVNGQEMAGGSDRSGSETGWIEVGGGKDDVWNFAGQRSKRNGQKNSNSKMKPSASDSEQSVIEPVRQTEEYKVIIKLSWDVSSFGKWNQIQLIKSINRLLGEVNNAQILQNGSLLIFCRDSTQQGKAIWQNKIDCKRMQRSLLEDRKFLRGVISGIPSVVSVNQLKIMWKVHKCWKQNIWKQQEMERNGTAQERTVIVNYYNPWNTLSSDMCSKWADTHIYCYCRY